MRRKRVLSLFKTAYKKEKKQQAKLRRKANMEDRIENLTETERAAIAYLLYHMLDQKNEKPFSIPILKIYVSSELHYQRVKD